jgi:hypothetical protein
MNAYPRATSEQRDGGTSADPPRGRRKRADGRENRERNGVVGIELILAEIELLSGFLA